jgi:hypothetical protein
MATTTSSSSAPINNLLFSAGSSEYYTAAFRQVLEDHMAYLRTNQSTSTITIPAQVVWENEQDLFGFLQTQNIAPQYHWVVMRLNNFTSPFQFKKGITKLLIPAFMLLEQIRSAYLTSNTISS